MSETYTVKEVAEILGFSTNSIYSFLKEGRIKGVKVGKGRFRISQEEIDRLLKINHPEPQKEPQKEEQVFPEYVSRPNEIVQAKPSFSPKLTSTDQVTIKVPSLFDWFIGLGSIIFGMTAILFIGHTNEFAIKSFTPFLTPIKITMISAGIGILLADIIGKTGIRWHKLFFFILGLAYLGMTSIYATGGDVEGIVIFGLTAIVMFLHVFWRIESVASFILYVGAIILLVPISMIIKPSISLITQPAFLGFLSNQTTLVLWVAISALVVGGLFFTYSRFFIIFRLSILLTTIDLAVLSYLYANSLFWGRSLFYLLAALISMLVPLWRSFHFLGKSDRKLIFVVFSGILLIFVSIISVLWIVQTNLKDYVGAELINKAEYGKNFLESVLTTSQTTLDNFDQNPLFLETINKKDSTTFNSLAKAILDATPNFRRILVFLPNGDNLFIYPYGRLDNPNISFRDYFQKTVTERKNVVSDLFETPVDGVTKGVVSVTTPIVDSKNELMGVLVGSLDLQSIGNRFQQLANDSKYEQFTVTDGKGKIVVNQNEKLIGNIWPLYSSSLSNRENDQTVSEDYNPAGDFIIHASTVDEKNGWLIDLAQPMVSALSITGKGALVIISFVLISGLAIIEFLSFLKRQM